jgi:hypothetical protein
MNDMEMEILGKNVNVNNNSNSNSNSNTKNTANVGQKNRYKDESEVKRELMYATKYDL